MAPRIGCLLCKLEDLSRDLWIRSLVVSICSLVLGWEGARDRRIPRAYCSAGLANGPMFSERTCVDKVQK